MIQKVIKKAILYLKHCNTIHTSEKRLDIRKLKLLLNTLGFNPTSNGTLYIIEELEFFYNNGIGEIKYLNEAYIISAKIHKTDIKNIQWNIESALLVMNKYADSNLIKEIFYWYDNYKNITPKYFLSTMLEFLNENWEKYQK